ncbi:MAG TPA: endonuclease MutS2, partial [Clostridia bacterium]|nr:endonuclease MutS2 [Clostridia bacterium]
YLLQLPQEVPLRGIRDIRSSLRKAELGGILEPDELLDVLSTLNAGRRIKNYLLNCEQKFPHLQELASKIILVKELEEEISSCIGESGEVLDSASAELAAIRRQIQVYQNRIREKLDNIIHSSSMQKMLQEPIITIRNDRYVIPLKQEYKGQFSGIIHDQSASGATLFIEPMVIVEMNNQLRQLKVKEEAEIKKILQLLANKIGSYSQELKINIKCLAKIDFIFAKGRLSEKFDGVEPILNKEGYFKIVAGRHPLLTGNVVPISLELGKNFRTLIITGPNTGGKTVSLKTVGLFVLLAQSGLHVPAKYGTELTVFSNLFCDIGDEQSIEQNLSTFSSHMKNIIDIVHRADYNSLVLLDELGAGTDPTEGAALARAILEYFHNKGIKTIATTHYSELKSFAFSQPEVENASVEFDAESLRPTYRLLIGLPGRSNAFYISSRLGLPQEIVDRARSMLSEEELKIENMIEDIQENKRISLREREEAEKIKLELASLKNKLELERRKWDEEKEKIRAKAREEALQLIKRTKRQAEEIIQELKRASQEAAEREKQLIIQKTKERINNLHSELSEQYPKQVGSRGPVPKKLKAGELVFVHSLNQKGQVVAEPDQDGQVVVQIGILKINTKLTDLERIQEEIKVGGTEKGIGKILSSKTTDISPELDLRGMNSDDALQELEKYLDDAYLAGLKEARINHGKGTGVLRNSVQQYLQGHRLVSEYRLGKYGEGGDGVTIVKFE